MIEVRIFLFDGEGDQQWQVTAEWVSTGARNTETELTETVRKLNPELLTNREYADWVAFCPAPPYGGLAATVYLGQEEAEEEVINWGAVRVRHLYLWDKDGTPRDMFHFTWNPAPGETVLQTLKRSIIEQLPQVFAGFGIATFHDGGCTTVINVEDLRRTHELRGTESHG